MGTLRPLLPWLAAGAGAMLVLLGVLLAVLYPHRQAVATWVGKWVGGCFLDSTTNAGSSKRTAGMSLIFSGIASGLTHPEHVGVAAVLIGGGLTALGISVNKDGTTALSGGIAALRGVLPGAPAAPPMAEEADHGG